MQPVFPFNAVPAMAAAFVASVASGGGSPTLIGFTASAPAYPGEALANIKDGSTSNSTSYTPSTDGSNADAFVAIMMRFSSAVALRYMSFFASSLNNPAKNPGLTRLRYSDDGGTTWLPNPGPSVTFGYPINDDAFHEGDYGAQGAHVDWRWELNDQGFGNGLRLLEIKAALTSGGTSLLGN